MGSMGCMPKSRDSRYVRAYRSRGRTRAGLFQVVGLTLRAVTDPLRHREELGDNVSTLPLPLLPAATSNTGRSAKLGPRERCKAQRVRLMQKETGISGRFKLQWRGVERGYFGDQK